MSGRTRSVRNRATIDARGLACPQPVLETKKVQDDGSIDHLVVLVDNHLSGLIGEETGM
jgi:TusA-related sulfurtransferase